MDSRSAIVVKGARHLEARVRHVERAWNGLPGLDWTFGGGDEECGLGEFCFSLFRIRVLFSPFGANVVIRSRPVTVCYVDSIWGIPS